MVRGRAQRIIGNSASAQDVAQECFIRLIEFRRNGGADRDTAAFLYRTVTNLALNRLRDAKVRRAALDQIAPPSAPVGQSAEDLIALRQVLALAHEEEAIIASYYYLDG